MDCKAVMAPIKTSLYTDETIGHVIDFMVEKHMGLVPVIERDGTFAGLIGGDYLIPYLMPRSLSSLGTLFRHGAMKKVSFLHETAEDMKERLDALRDRPIGEIIARNVKVATPETPLIDALMMIREKQYVVPVVDAQYKLVGAISFFSVMYGLNQEYDRETVERLKAEERAKRQEQVAERDVP
jgi:CBS-domain-containing membrane protein